MAQFPNGARNYSIAFGSSSAISAIIQTRAPASTDTHGPNGIFPVGQPWIDSSGGIIYGLTSLSTSGGVVSANWVSLGSSSSGDIATLTGDSGGAISPVSANIDLLGTASEITTTGTAGTITFSLPAIMIAPGSLEVTGLLTGDASATINTAGTALNLATDVDVDTVNIGTAGARDINIGNVLAGTITIDAVTDISIGDNVDLPSITIANAVPAASRTVTISSGAVAVAGATDRVRIATGGVSTEATAIKLVDIATGSTLVGEQRVNINTGTAASGTCETNISTGTGGGTKTVNIGNSDLLTTTTIKGPLNFDSVDVVQSLSSAAVPISNQITNSDNTDLGSDASYQVATGGSASGDPYINFLVSGAGVFSMGIDNSDSDNFVLSANAALGTSNALTVTSAGVTTSTGDINTTDGDLVLGTAGNRIISTNYATTTAAGANAFGVVTLVNGAATIATTSVTAASGIILSRMDTGATGAAALGLLTVENVVAGTSFGIRAATEADSTATATTDVSVVAWFFFN